MPGRGGSRRARRRFGLPPRPLAGIVALGAVLVLAVPAAPAGAQTTAAPDAHPGLCARVHNQYDRAVKANARAKVAFEKASALQQRLLQQRPRLAHRLDVRLQYLRQLHELLVDRVNLIASRASGVCSEKPPVLESY